jgi:hypothetical protein
VAVLGPYPPSASLTPDEAETRPWWLRSGLFPSSESDEPTLYPGPRLALKYIDQSGKLLVFDPL